MSGRKKLIIDVDTGIDDAQAIMMALSHPDTDVLGITCVSGNVHVDQVCTNTLKVLQVCNRLDVPVYRGSDHSIIFYKREKPSGVHGQDGLGDFENYYQMHPCATSIQNETAHLALLRMVNDYSGEITLVALGPLTNIALVLNLDPTWGSKLKNAVIMGGNIKGIGNVTASAEFNFYVDPEAAQATLAGLKCPVELLSWETCHYHNCMSWEWFDKLMKVDTAKGKFHAAINERSAKRKKEIMKCDYYSCDPAAVAVALEPSIVSESVHRYCCVETSGSLTRGQMVVDWRGWMKTETNVSIIQKIDIEKLKEMYERMLI